eukprot:TRINITY_DN10067_c0_g1_i2.p1 TRINITY_DN10067_c0_g1~~TRINITY_DN10067_c0_g1_i2.p1  ORF type:complete len:276 (-),score=77.85 TRINITY_DN10067_c0_g1_i2:93-920(-)
MNIVFALAQIYGVEGDISSIARVGSGSACRSMFGGFVKWEMGANADGSDSLAVQVAPETHWPEIEILILVVNDHRKDTSSTEGMQQSVVTCDLMTYRCKEIVPRRMKEMEHAILSKDFEKFADLTMRDSDDFHAICAATQPPIYYMNDISRRIVGLIHKFNKASGQAKVAYTFDAGPNACLYLPKQNVAEVLSLVLSHFPAPSTTSSNEYVRSKDETIVAQAKAITPSSSTASLYGSSSDASGLKYILHTKVGPGPQIITDPSMHLIDEKGHPKL